MKALPALSDMERDWLPGLSPNSLAVSPDGGLIAVGGGGTTDKSGDPPGGGDDVLRGPGSWISGRVRSCGHTSAGVGTCSSSPFRPTVRSLASDTGLEVRLWDATGGDLKQTFKPRSGDRMDAGVLSRQSAAGGVWERDRRGEEDEPIDGVGGRLRCDRPFDRCGRGRPVRRPPGRSPSRPTVNRWRARARDQRRGGSRSAAGLLSSGRR